MKRNRQTTLASWAWAQLVLALCVGATQSSSVHAQTPPEPWTDQGEASDPSLIEAFHGLVASAMRGISADFRSWFTPTTQAQLEAAWGTPEAVEAGWAALAFSLLTKDGTAPLLLELELDAESDGSPATATAVIQIGRDERTIYWVRLDAGWRVEVRRLRANALKGLALFSDDESSLFEVTVGSAYGFPTQYVGNYTDDVEIVGTASLFVMGEYFALPWLRIGIIYDMPLGPEVLHVKGVEHREVLPSRVTAGINWVPMYVDFAKHSRVEFQLLTYVGMTIEKEPEPVPMVAGRVAFLQDAVEGVDIYFGGHYLFVLNKAGFLFGVGYRF